MVQIVRPQRIVTTAEVHWCEAIETSELSRPAKDAMRPFFDRVSDLCVDDMHILAQCLAKIESGTGPQFNDAGFNVSARSIMGGSKVLDHLAPKMLQALGLPARLQISSPRYVICAGPASPEATLLIENPRAFENAVRSGLSENVSLVCTYGFGLSYLGQSWRDETLEQDKPIQIVRCGTPGSLTSLLSAPRVFLWADLDLAALSIYRSLRTAIPQLKFSSIYKVMMDMANDPERSHPYAAIFEKEGQLSGSASTHDTADSFAFTIAASCRQRAVDQEAVSEQQILEFGPY
jgi:hypothetical protein